MVWKYKYWTGISIPRFLSWVCNMHELVEKHDFPMGRSSRAAHVLCMNWCMLAAVKLPASDLFFRPEAGDRSHARTWFRWVQSNELHGGRAQSLSPKTKYSWRALLSVWNFLFFALHVCTWSHASNTRWDMDVRNMAMHARARHVYCTCTSLHSSYWG